VTERPHAAVLAFEGREPPVPAPGDVLEEDPLDGILGAVGENLVGRRLDEAVTHRSDTLSGKP
jgi:hypothetical protein